MFVLFELSGPHELLQHLRYILLILKLNVLSP